MTSMGFDCVALLRGEGFTKHFSAAPNSAYAVADPGHIVRGDLYVSHFQWQLPATPESCIN